MGRVKEWWMEEREKRFNKRCEELMALGYSPDDAHEITFQEFEDEDVANGQFGVGA